MKLYFILLTLFCYSQLSFPMLVPYTAFVKQTKKIVQVPQRAMGGCIGCTCIRDIKKGNIKKTEKSEFTIAVRNRLVKDARELIKNKKEEWQRQGVFPEKEGLALEQALSSYCPHFESCACKVGNKKFRAQMGIVATIIPSICFVAYLDWDSFLLVLSMFPNLNQHLRIQYLQMFFLFGTTLYSSLSLCRARTYEKILAQKAEADRDSLEPLFRSFVKAYGINLFYSKKQSARQAGDITSSKKE